MHRRYLQLAMACVSLLALGCAARRPPAEADGERRPSDGMMLFLTADTGQADGGAGPSVWVMDSDGGQRRLIGSAAQSLWAEWSPAGASLAFIADHRQLGLHSLADGRTRTIDLDSRTVLSASWFDDGRRIAIAWMGKASQGSQPNVSSTGISVVDTTTGHIEDLHVERQTVDSLFFRVAVRPGGTEVAAGQRSAVSLLKVPGNGSSSLEGILDVGPLAIPYFEWSPDGKFLSYTAMREDGTGALWVYDTSAKQSSKVQDSAGHALVGRWHPKLAQLAYAVVGGTPPQSRLYFAKLEGGEWHTRLVLSMSGVLGVGGWSADGMALAYVVDDGESSRIYVASADGPNGHPISPPGAHDRGASWQP